MFADLSPSNSSALAGRIGLLFWRLSRAFESRHEPQLPAEVVRLPDRLLHDVGIEPHRVRLLQEDFAIELERLRQGPF